MALPAVILSGSAPGHSNCLSIFKFSCRGVVAPRYETLEQVLEPGDDAETRIDKFGDFGIAPGVAPELVAHSDQRRFFDFFHGFG